MQILYAKCGIQPFLRIVPEHSWAISDHHNLIFVIWFCRFGTNFSRKVVIRILQNIRLKRNSYRILQELRSKYWWETLLENTSDGFGILKNFDQNSGWKCSCSQSIRWLRNSFWILIRILVGKLAMEIMAGPRKFMIL